MNTIETYVLLTERLKNIYVSFRIFLDFQPDPASLFFLPLLVLCTSCSPIPCISKEKTDIFSVFSFSSWYHLHSYRSWYALLVFYLNKAPIFLFHTRTVHHWKEYLRSLNNRVLLLQSAELYKTSHKKRTLFYNPLDYYF